MSVSYSPSGEDHWMQWITDLLATAPRVLAMDNWAFDSPDRLLHILAASSTLLEDLSLRRINVSTPIQSPEAEPVSIAPTVTRLDALRNLTLCCVEPSILAERAIECPNLNSFFTDNSSTTGSFPPWIPKELSKFTLHVRQNLDPTFCFPKTTRLSEMMLHISGTASSPETYSTWIENCINHSSFPRLSTIITRSSRPIYKRKIRVRRNQHCSHCIRQYRNWRLSSRSNDGSSKAGRWICSVVERWYTTR
ncbi:hypothetical protein PTI98_008212 [Pleurotus ostreatus]|nr:hypothetical protein PTI98_008212 [Pleurotus ostreatus]